MSKPYDFLVFIGRFQPFHYGHAKVIEQALEQAENVLVLVGSANAPRSWRNPFTFEERAKVIHNWALSHSGGGTERDRRVVLLPLEDFTYNDQGWITSVQTIVDSAVRSITPGWTDKPPKIGLIGHSKDNSSYYLGLFPQWGSVNVGAYTDRRLFNSTDVREVYFSQREWAGSQGEFGEGLPAATICFLREFHNTEDWEWLYKEHQYVVKYKEDHAYAKDLPYEATHTTVDAVVVYSGHVLLIRRGTHPGKGQLCLPGGFIDPGETLLDGMLRELREETKIKVPRPVLAGNVKQQMVFDDPNRSSRGRVFSHTFLINLPPQADGLPKVKASSDALAGSAKWVPLSSLKSEDFFEDHYHIARKMTAGL